MQVREIMTKPVEVIDPNAMIRDAARKMRDKKVGALPVCESHDHLVGMVTDRDIVVRAVAENLAPGNTAVRVVMSEGVYYCYEDEPLERAAEIMAQHQVRRLPVLNREKRLVGIITLGDIGRQAERVPEVAERVLEGVAAPGHEPRR